ncbi:class A beta-lactamase [Burkholderia guangdongensis]|uniref:class A beta-lactamase n=1 Tax=Burkholderia guangdongensis TaxID=1792500 RepID=UPI0015CB8132|nr:class A beta-lactamase [Burkholderia guangdongensis]
MDHSSLRRSLLLAAVAGPFVAACAPTGVAHDRARAVALQLQALEQSAHGRLGVAALDTSNGARLAYRSREHFPLCGTFTVVAVAALLTRAALDPTLLPRRVLYRRYDLVPDSPVTNSHADTGLTVAQLCEAALQAGDQSAANMVMDLLGGPAVVTEFAHSIGDTTFRLDRWEPELNTARPGDLRDTGTPVATADTLRRLLLGNTLPDAQRAQLQAWMLGNAGGAAGGVAGGMAGIRAGLPSDWRVAHVYGAGGYGTTNDIAVVWPPSRAPLVLAIYFTQPAADAAPHDDVVASAARIVAAGFTG